MSRDHVLHKVRTALGRSAGQPPAPVPPALIAVPEVPLEKRIESFCRSLEKLAGKTKVAAGLADARQYVEAVIAGQTAVSSQAPLLVECGITSLAGVQKAFADAGAWRAACAEADVGITSADYALADTGTLVLLSSPAEARLISLLPPVHVAVVSRQRLLTGLDELLTVLANPADQSSAMVLITGPSRTADIEQILVRGVHGPGEIHVVLV